MVCAQMYSQVAGKQESKHRKMLFPFDLINELKNINEMDPYLRMLLSVFVLWLCGNIWSLKIVDEYFNE